MASYRVKFPGGVEVECATAEEAAALIALKSSGNGKPAEPAAAAAPAPVEAAPSEVIDDRPTGNRGVDALREIEGAGRLVWDWLTSEQDPRKAILEALDRNRPGK